MGRDASAMIRRLQSMGVDATVPVDINDWNKARIAIRSSREVVQDATLVVRSRAAVTIGLGVVSEEKSDKNMETCRSNECGHYGKSAQGHDLCWKCQCSGRDLIRKTRTRGQRCPADPPYWSNA